IDKGLADIHAIMETPKGDKHPHPFFAKLPEIESFARNDKERKIIALQRAFRIAGTPFVLPPGTAKDRVEVLQEAFRKTYRDPEFAKEYRKLTADDPTPLLPENHEKAIREIAAARIKTSSLLTELDGRCMIMTSPKVRPKSWILLGACGLIVGLLWNSAHAQAPFYQGKTVTVVVGTSPAGTGDLRVKALIPFLRKHIPGNHALVLEYMDGGGGRKAANYMFRTARPDGLTIGAMSSGVISLNIMRESGVLDVWRVFRSVGSPYVLPPGTPK